ncbi:hypothetical protein EST38_g10937 [Candolleomyces aberdarensis]|uniref:Uncharacterized protein n=1 Tax=Candolleomyces aberdarensis TaxID=2316362 RepID=A0A4Q2D7Q9_9AGAR|nr:hypothetical protein EST38_g10937 [Candolleomyces aberdarensis]
MPALSRSEQQRRAASDLGLQAQDQADHSLEHSLATAQASLLEAGSQIETLEETISIQNQKNSELRITNGQLSEKISSLEARIASQEARIASLCSRKSQMSHDLRMARQKCARQLKCIDGLCKTITDLKEIAATGNGQLKDLKSQHNDALLDLHLLETQNQKLSKTLSKVQASGGVAQQEYKERLVLMRSKLTDSQKQASMLKKKTQRASGVLERSIARTAKKTLTQATTYHLMEKGVFKEPVRDLVCYLFKTGVPAYCMNEVIHSCCSLVGIELIGKISRTSAAHFIREGEVSAKLQIGYELSQTQGMFCCLFMQSSQGVLQSPAFTFSADGTGDRAINYNSRHLNLKAEDYTTGEVSHKTRFLGIMPSMDGSSAESIKDYDLVLGNICDLFNRSPFGKRARHDPLRLVDIFVKLTGMHTDHCSKEKRDAEALKQKKENAVHQILGEKQIVGCDEGELLPHFVAACKKMVEKLGGQKVWEKLSETEQAEHNAKMLEGIIVDLGKESLELMSDDEKRALTLFLWAGCGCHKDLNTVRGGYTSMVQWYQEHESEPQPILLANRDNAPVLAEITTEGDIENEVQARAFEMTGRGGIKCAQIAGAILNNKLDKKRHHDVFRWWWQEEVGCAFTFPDTSNTRFGSYCDAAIALIVNLDNFKKFLEFVKEKKNKHRWSHMEQNLWDALHDAPTLCELVILGLYAEVIGIPYITKIREHAQNKVNMLDLGPLHNDVYKHMQILSAKPGQLLVGDPTVSHLTSVLYGNTWSNPTFIEIIHSMGPSLPNITNLLGAFFAGACATWKRFTSEFAPGGLIDEASQEEKELAWIMPTNDINEGALGSFRVMMRRQPQLSLTGYNAQAMYFHNDTQAFVKKHFVTPEDLKFVHTVARENSGEDWRCRKEIIEHGKKCAAEKVARREKRQKQAEDKRSRLDQLQLVFDKNKVPDLKGDRLKDMLDKFKEAGAPHLDNTKRSDKVGDIRNALIRAIESYHEGEWGSTSDTSQESEDESEDDEESSKVYSDDGASGWSDSDSD